MKVTIKEEMPARRAMLRGALTVGCSLLLPAALLGCDPKPKTPEGGTAPSSPPPSPPTPSTPSAPSPSETPGTPGTPGTSGATTTPGTPSAAAPSTSSQATGAADSAAPKKVSQASVEYQLQPKGGLKCADCVHFIADSSSCKLVEGQISSEGWCVLWVKKT